MRRINTLAELRFEQRALRSKALNLEAEIKQDLHAIKEMFAPLKMITNGAESVLVSKDNGLLGNSAGFVADFLARNVLFKNSGLLTKLIVPYLAKNFAGTVVDNNKSAIVGWVGGLISKFGKNRKDKKEEEEEQEKLD